MFNPQPGQNIQIGAHDYQFTPHPGSPFFAYGQEGRMAIVYQVRQRGTNKYQALKVFKAAYRSPKILHKAQELRPFATIPGLQACAREVIDPQAAQYQRLLRQYPDLAYAVLMPWVRGKTWSDIMLQRKPLQRQRAWNLAWSLATLLTEMEKRGIAHCDLSGANLLIEWNQKTGYAIVSLVDVEQMYADGISSPDLLLVGSPGYTPHFDREQLWSPLGDRFAGAVLIGEILGWYHPAIVEHGNEQSFFLPDEIHTQSKRYNLLLDALAEWGPQFASLFQRAWEAESLAQCPSFAEWRQAFLTSQEGLETNKVNTEASILRRGPRATSQDIQNATADFNAPSTTPPSKEAGDTAVAYSEEEVKTSTIHPSPTNISPSSEALLEHITPEATAVASDSEREQHRTSSLETLQDWRNLAQQAKQARHAGNIGEAMRAYQRAITLALQEEPEAARQLIMDYNNFIFAQIEILQRDIYQTTTQSVQSLSWSYHMGRWLAGLSTLQLSLLGLFVVLAAFFTMAIFGALAQAPFFATFSLGAAALALLMGLFPTSPLPVTLLYSLAIYFGLIGVAIHVQEKISFISPLLIGTTGSWFFTWLWTRIDHSPQIPSWFHALWVTSVAILIGLLVDDLTYGGIMKLLEADAILFNTFLAFGMWFIGKSLRDILIAYREVIS